MKSCDLVLLGAGHAHLGVLRLWAAGQRPPGRIVLVSPQPFAWYSGMLPGLLAWRYQPDECRIALEPLCQAAEVELIEGTVEHFDARQSLVRLGNGQLLKGRYVSLNLGGQTRVPPQRDVSLDLLGVKPFSQFLAGWQRWQQEGLKPLAIVGGGPAAIELALALSNQPIGQELALICQGELLEQHPAALRQKVRRLLAQQAVELREHCRVDLIEHNTLRLSNGRNLAFERVILATGSAPLDCWQTSGLPLDKHGFIRINPQLQALNHKHVFAVGDSASLPGAAHNGVYAVRMGPVLAANLAASLQDKPLQRYKPQAQTLALLADGSGGALLSWHGLSASGRWVGWWKHWLDQRFMQRHRWLPLEA
ncbi:FAD-dependent oxidoreductase [Atopomonas sediminilitoris]|uniref:FAD-dependent oxidoreductase n=1 Tax=Atopomonas sediminilitoris TaxID=2919919 RepID=UPI001F4DCD12|nr:FAD-dependent oxidoreductase [Atopomonas sediminilitoris]MCJ8169382.1 FAD-dependent oxidoreductase [Atopomonas sediminilitoris]